MHGPQCATWIGRFIRWGFDPKSHSIVECAQVFASWWQESMSVEEWDQRWTLLVAESTAEITDDDQAAIDAAYAAYGFGAVT